MHIPLPAILLLGLFGVAACATTDPARVERKRQAQVASEMGDWGRAAGLWYGLYREDPRRSGDLAVNTAHALLESGQPSSALAVVRDSRRFGATSPALGQVAARAREQLGDRVHAIEELRDALREDPGQAEWWWTLAQWLWAEGEVQSCHRALERAGELGRDGPDLRLLLARVLTATDDHARAYDAWRVVLRREAAHGSDSRALVEGARVAASPRVAIDRPQALERAVVWYERALALEPQDLEAQREFARAARLAGDEERALAAFERASELDPTDAELLAELAEFYLMRGNKDRARELLQRALDLETDPEWTAEWQRRIDAAGRVIEPAD